MNIGSTSASSLPKVVLLFSKRQQQRILTPTALRQLAACAHIVGPTPSAPLSAELPCMLKDAVACITCWDTPPLHTELLNQLPTLRLIAHSAGSIRSLIPEYVLRPGVQITHAALALAEGVAEFTIMQALLCLTHLLEFDRRLKAHQSWEEVLSGSPTRLLSAQSVGIIGAGHVGREVIARLKAFHCRMLVYDPYLHPDEARRLGVELTDLETLLTSAQIVTLHAPLLPETRGMIGAGQLALLRNNAIFLNTARAGLVDEQALIRELQTGRIMAALDVFQHEPLPVESPLRDLPNVILSPHIAALTAETLLKQGQMMVDEVERFLQNEQLHYAITDAMLPIIA